MAREPEGKYSLDQTLLAEVLWPLFQNDSVQHDSYHCEQFPGSRPFPTVRAKTGEFVGNYYFENFKSEFARKSRGFKIGQAVFGQMAPLKCRPDPEAPFG